MNTLLSQIRYFKQKKKRNKDMLANLNQISSNQTNQRVKILFRQTEGSSWKYCIAPVISYSILYTFLKIKWAPDKQFNNSNIAYFEVEIFLQTIKQPQKSLFQKFSIRQLYSLVSSLSSFLGQTVSCQIKRSKNKQKKITFKFKIFKQFKYTCQKLLKMSFFLFFIIIQRLKLCYKLKQSKQKQVNQQICELRLSISSNLKAKQNFNQKLSQKQVYDHLKNQSQQAIRNYSIITLSNKNLFENKNHINLSFIENVQKRAKLQKSYQKAEQKRRNLIKKEKIYSNIEIQKQENVKGFCIQTKFSIITQCSLVFKIIRTHINRRYQFQKSTQNQQYFNYLLDITKTQQKLCVRKRPLQLSLDQSLKNQMKNNEQKNYYNELKQKTKRILKTQKNCLDIMKQSWVSNICPYYVHYKQQDTLYSKLYKMSLDEWKQQKKRHNDKTLIDVFLQMFNGLHELGQYNIIHRDLKPDNIMVDDSYPLIPVVKLIDFGSTIYIHSNSQKYEQNVHSNFDSKLRTTKPYNMDLNQYRKICYAYFPQGLNKYSESSYNRHAKFDIYSGAKIMEQFGDKFNNQQVLNNIKFMIKICLNPDPQFRLSIKEAGLFLSTIKNFYFP